MNDDDLKTPLSGSFFGSFFGDDDDVFQNEEALKFERNQALNAEIAMFTTKIANKSLIKPGISTREFWKTNSLLMPYLFKMSKILLTIPSSSAYIERFFSVSGFVCDRRRMNMKDDLIVSRSLLKTNFHISEEMNEMNE